MTFEEALSRSALHGAIYLGSGYVLALLDHGLTCVELRLDEQQRMTRWCRWNAPVLDELDMTMMAQHPDYDAARWEPLLEMEQVTRYNDLPEHRGAGSG